MCSLHWPVQISHVVKGLQWVSMVSALKETLFCSVIAPLLILNGQDMQIGYVLPTTQVNIWSNKINSYGCVFSLNAILA